MRRGKQKNELVFVNCCGAETNSAVICIVKAIQKGDKSEFKPVAQILRPFQSSFLTTQLNQLPN